MSDFDEFERKLGVFVEQMNDQFERVLEAVDSKSSPIAESQAKIEKKLGKLSDDVEMIKADTKMQNVKIDSIQHDVKMLKLRSDTENERLDDLDKDVKSLDARVAKLETI